MKPWATTLPNVQYPQMPQEDFYLQSGNAFCVADGITRDPIGLKNFSGWKTENILKHYPNPSPAAKAAKLTAESFVELVKNNPRVDLKTTLMEVNRKVAELNNGLPCDYLENDFAACVAAGGRIINAVLDWAAIGDCQLAIFDQTGLRRFLSPNGVASFLEFTKQSPGNWSDPARRVEVRSQFRNNPQQLSNGKIVAYGALTGEKTAESFIMSGQEKLAVGDTVIFFSDGFAETLEHPQFWEKLNKGKDEFLKWDKELSRSDPNKYGHERTMIAIIRAGN